MWIGAAYVGIVERMLPVHCQEVSQLWSFAFSLFGVALVSPNNVIDLLAVWRNWLEKHSSKIWIHVCLARAYKISF